MTNPNNLITCFFFFSKLDIFLSDFLNSKIYHNYAWTSFWNEAQKSRWCIGDRTSALLDESWLMGGLNIVKLTNLDLELPDLVQLM